MKAVVKSGLETVAARVVRGVPGLRRGDALILAYHNVVPDGWRDGDGSLHLWRSRFEAQLDLVRERHDVVPLAELGSVRRGRRGRGVVAITFDDGYRGAATLAVDALVARGLPATLFVSPAFVPDGAFWWDSLSDGRNGLNAARRLTALSVLGGRHARVRRWASRVGLPWHVPAGHARAASEEELRRAAALPGITLGSHTWSHPDLRVLPPAALRRELRRPLVWLRERFEAVVPWLSYPYGLASAAVREAAAAAGYDGAVDAKGGWFHAGRVNPTAVPRLTIPSGLSLDGFRLRLVGLLDRR